MINSALHNPVPENGVKGEIMENYTSLEQALQDTSLVLITDAAATQKELNKVYVRYKTLPRKQKRYSNYYSHEFLGHTVPEMYAIRKDKLKVDNFSYEEGPLQDRKQMFGRETRNYFLDEGKINSYRSYFSNRLETIFRTETNEASRKEEAVINELNSIDRCFVNDDADGIRAIMKNAEANTEFSNMDRMRIVNECKLALIDVRLSNGKP